MKIWSQLKGFFRKGKLDTELSDEIRAHLELQAERNRAAGMSADDAHYAAQRSFGGVEQVKERCRDQRGLAWLEQAWNDFRYAARSLRKAPGFTFAVVGTLTVGIGLVTAVSNVARPILRPNLPFREADRLVLLRERSPQFQGGYTVLLPSRFADYARRATSFVALGAEKIEVANLVVQGEPYSVRVSAVTEGFFAALGVACKQGRLFAKDDIEPALAGGTMVLSHDAWAKFFGRDPAIIGQDVALGGRLRRVIGILVPGFKTTPFSNDGDGIYLSTTLEPTPARNAGASNVNAIGRLKPDTTVIQAQAELRTIRPEMPSPTSTFYSQLEPSLASLADAFRENRAQPFWIFLAAAGALYLIGCTTVANLMLSRGVGRQRELGVRLALGGTPARIVRLIVVESLLLALLGAGAGALLAEWAQRLMAVLAPSGFGGEEVIAPFRHWRTFAFTLAVGIPTCVMSALLPAWRASRIGLAEAMKEGGAPLGESRRLRLLRSAFVVAQSALAVALLIGAGLMIRTVSRLQHIDLGFNPARKFVLVGYRVGMVDPDRLELINSAVVERIAALPGVAQVALTTTVPALGVVSLSSYTIEGREAPEPISANSFTVTPGYFNALEMPIIAGTGFEGFHKGDRAVAVIDESMARDGFPNGNPVGQYLVSDRQRLEIVGMVRNVVVGFRGGRAMSKGGALSAQIYTPSWQSRPSRQLNAIVRLHQDPDPGFAAALRRAVFNTDPSIVVTLRPLDEVIGNWSRTERQTLLMLQILSGLALGLATFGTFSVMAYSVVRRRNELGLRLVLGATPDALMAFVLRRGLALGGLGIWIGVAAGAGLSGFLRAVLYETSPHEPLVYAAVASLLLITSLLACWLPARRAARVDPMVALRCE